jgi:hypothetical protein
LVDDVRILQVYPHYDHGGTETVLAMLDREWTAAGHDVLSWLPRPTADPPAALRALTGEAYPDRWRPDAVVVHGGLVGASDLGVSRRSTGAPVVEVIHRRHPARPGATRYVAVSRAVAGVQREVACTVIPNGVDMPGPRRTREAARAALGIDPDTLVVARHARTAIEKGWHWTMSTMQRVWDAGVPAWLLVVGARDQPGAAVLRGWARGRPCAVASWTANPADHLVAADVYVETSPDEAFGLAVAEAGLLGLPAVAFAASGVAETVGDACPTAPVGDTAALAGLLVDLARDERARAEWSLRLRRRVRARYAPALCARRYARLLDRLR